jgi:hypothetical protein
MTSVVKTGISDLEQIRLAALKSKNKNRIESKENENGQGNEQYSVVWSIKNTNNVGDLLHSNVETVRG